jgi:hypothetical protein
VTLLENGEKWTQECITKLNRISNFGKRKDKMASELQENILHLKEKQERENQNTIRRRQTIVFADWVSPLVDV